VGVSVFGVVCSRRRRQQNFKEEFPV